MPTRTFLNLPEEKQKRILNAAIEEFGKRNVQEANLSNIISMAGISRGSLYQYFENKEDMYVYVFDTLRSQRSEYVKPAFKLYKKAPFLDFFIDFYVRDSEYLLKNPSHLELGKHLYTHGHGISRRLISRIQTKYRGIFLVAIEYDKEHNIISNQVDSAVLSDLCVHFATDVFIFQSLGSHLSLGNLREHMEKTLYIIKNGIIK